MTQAATTQRPGVTPGGASVIRRHLIICPATAFWHPSLPSPPALTRPDATSHKLPLHCAGGYAAPNA